MSNICQLNQGSYTLTVNGVPVVVDPANNVVADQYGKATCLFFKKNQSGDVCTYNIFTDSTESQWAEYNEQTWQIYIQSYDDQHPQPRFWTINSLNSNTYSIAPGPPSANGWTAPVPSGQIFLTTLLAPPSAEQQFVLTSC